MSTQKQKKVNIELVAIALRNAFIIIGAIWIIIPTASDLLGIDDKSKYLIVAGLHIIICALLILIVNTQEKYKVKK